LSVTLADILKVIETLEIWGNPDIKVKGVSHDSRKVMQDYAFVAITGDKSDGHDFVAKAVERGANVVIAQKLPPRDFDFSKCVWVRVENSRQCLGPLSSWVYGRPSENMKVVAITGTNGKTTTTFLLESILRTANSVPGVVGTISHRWPGVEVSAANTTPEASDIQKMLSEMKSSGVTHVIMEASSHGLFMRRLDGCNFDVGVFSNLTHDHLDFHQNMEAYYEAKKILFTELLPLSSKRNVCAAINIDDPYGFRLANETASVSTIKFGSTDDPDICPTQTRISQEGVKALIQTPEGPIEIESSLVGAFNLSNILASISVSLKLGIPKATIFQGIKNLKTVPGRLERVDSRRGAIFVDYAHTPNALKNVLQALREVCSGRLITLMGCGGDRDKTKRPVMGMEAAGGSDFVIITSDNPRSEDPLEIISQIEPGVLGFGFSKSVDGLVKTAIKKGSYIVIPDRKEAIKWAMNRMDLHDTLLLAGKGHETYQEIHGIRYPFDDRQIALEESRDPETVVSTDHDSPRPFEGTKA
jgi:UDP-N-acetylmuramoyl-L-alanyl-D-glutamate--2,6-diaminopimelate ligase